MRSEFEALLQAVYADLDDDQPRLVLADALQQIGDPRGELIAVQCELAHLGCRHLGLTTDRVDRECDWLADGLVEGDRARIISLRARERTLLEDHRTQWTSHDDDLFVRGFVEHAFGRPNPGATFDRAPCLRSLEVPVSTPDCLADPRLGQLGHLEITLGNQARSEWLFSEVTPQMPRLRSLGLHADRPVLDRVLAMPGVEKLERLTIDGRYATALDDVLAASTISDLRIWGGVPESRRELAARLVAGMARQQIRTLVLEGCELRDDTATILQAAPHLEVLRVYEAGNGWLPSTLPAIAALRALRVLDLTGNNLAGLHRRLLAGEYPALRVLRLGYCRLGEVEIRALRHSSIIASLRMLDLRINLASEDTVVKALLQSRFQPPLELLILSHMPEPELTRELRAKFPLVRIEARS